MKIVFAGILIFLGLGVLAVAAALMVGFVVLLFLSATAAL